MAKLLKVARIDEVSLVDSPANQLARVLLFKRDEPVTKNDDEADEMPLTTQQILDRNEAQEDWWELQCALSRSVQSIMDEAAPADQPALLERTLREFLSQAEQLIPKVSPSVAKRLTPIVTTLTALAKEGRAISTDRLQRLKDALATLEQIIQEGTPAEKEPKMAETDVEKRATAAEARVKELEAQLAKGDPEALAKRVEAAEQRAIQAEAVAKREQELREEREYIAKAQGYTTLPVHPKDDWKVFKAIDAMDAPTRDRLLELLDAADGQLAIAGALGAVGKGGERRGGTSAWDEISTLATGIISKSTGMTFDTAVQQVLRERPDLYDRHRKESGDRS